MVSDAAKLPATTNMGLGNRPAPTASIAPASRAQPISQSQRAMIPTQQETANAKQQAYSTLSHSWEEDDAEPRAKPKPPPPSNAIFLQAIPCFFVTNVKNATTFYKDILGFETLGKPDVSFASLYRAPPQAIATLPIRRIGGGGAQTGKLDAPPGSVQLYLRLTPMDSNGVRIQPPAVTLWMLVNDVDEVFKEITIKWNKFTPQQDEYFPVHLFGEAKIVAKPRNTAFGTRELHVVDGDDNKIIFFKHLY
jgi:catechol 2,3-dioxygenase-like lactoylglutathione lyase family enzyme